MRPDPLHGSRRVDLLYIAAGLALICVAWTGFAITDGSLLFDLDGIEETYPWWMFGIHELQSLRYPFWNPFTSGGMSAVGDVTCAYFYPPFAAFAFAGSHALTTKAIYAFAFLHFFIGLLGAYVLARTLNLPPPAALVTGILYPFGEVLSRRANVHLCIFNGETWIPWMLAGIVLAFTTQRLRWATLSGFAAGMSVLAGHFLALIDGGLMAAILTAFLVFSGDRSKLVARIRFAAGIVLIAGLVAVAVSAAQLVATVEYLPWAFRSMRSVDPATGLRYVIGTARTPWAVIAAEPSFHLPGLLGVAVRFVSPGPENGDLYIGAAMLLLAIIGLTCEPPRLRILWGGLIGLGIVLGLGAATPILRIVCAIVPLIEKIRQPVRHVLISHTALAVCAGYGAAAVLALDRRAKTAIAVFAALLVAAAVVIAETHVPKPSIAAIAIAACAAFIAPLLVWIAMRSARAAAISVAALTALAFVELVYGWFAFMPKRLPQSDGVYQTAVEKYYGTPAVRRLSAFLREHPDVYRVDVGTHLEPGPVNRTAPVPNNLAQIARFLSIGGYGSTKPALFVTLVSHLGGHPPSIAADLLATRYLATKTETKSLREVARFGPMRVYENSSALPFARLVESVEFSRDDTETVERLRRTGARVDTAIVPATQRSAVEQQLRGSRASLQPAVASVVQYLPNAVTIRTRTDSARLLATADPYYPGWRASIDGRETPVIRTDYAFRGVVVPAGEHTVVFRYTPWHIYFGMIVTSIAFIAAVAIVLREFLGSQAAPVHSSA